jgi:competence protein ComEC
MQKIAPFLENIFAQKQDDLWVWIPVLFGFGAAFYLCFEEGFRANIFAFAALFFIAAIACFLNRNSWQFLVFLACLLFLLGSFYAVFYQKIFLNYTKISGKIYADAVGKVESVKKFYNPVNHLEGLNLVITKPVLYKYGSWTEFSSKKERKIKKIKKKQRKTSGEKAVLKNFINVENYQEIDRKFLDYSKNYQHVLWLEDHEQQVFFRPPPKISVTLAKSSEKIAVNDVIVLPVMLQPPRAKIFPDDFDFIFAANAKKIAAYGFGLGEAKILKKAQISNLDDWFSSLRQKIGTRILYCISGNSGAIALAFLIGDSSYISKDLMAKIRNSGLAHLLSISGFHLSLAGTICFVTLRFALSRIEYLALHFDLKKIAAVSAIFGTYFYLEIAACPIPAKRAFMMLTLILMALFLDEKINARRAIMISALVLILLNPYIIFNVGFQLSFAAILVLRSFYDAASNRSLNSGFFYRFFWYFAEIIVISIAIQIATAPFLMHSFQNFTLFGFIANIMAIPLACFFVMPLGFLSLFLMLFGLEKYTLFLMAKAIFLIEKIAIFVADLKFSHFVSPQFSGAGFVIAILGLLLFCLAKSSLRLVGIAAFFLSFVIVFYADFYTKKPGLLFDGGQKFFAVYDKKEGLIFSKDLRPSKKRQLWMKKMGETSFKSFLTRQPKEIFCDAKHCLIDKGYKILVLLARNKISEICRNDFDVIVNLTARYNLPACIAANKIKIDNLDFYQKGGHFFYFKDQKISLMPEGKMPEGKMPEGKMSQKNISGQNMSEENKGKIIIKTTF